MSPFKPSQKLLHLLCLLLAPLCLSVVELFHPARFTHHPGAYEYLSKPEGHDTAHHTLEYLGAEEWFWIHMVQTPLVVLVAIGLWQLTFLHEPGTRPRANFLAFLTRCAIFMFVVYYTVMDAIAGIGFGRLMLLAGELHQQGVLDAHQVKGVSVLIDKAWTDPWIGGVGSVVSETGSWAIFIAAFLLAVLLRIRFKVHLLTALLMVLFGGILQVSHAAYTGPTAFFLLAITSLLLLKLTLPSYVSSG